jgi:hypothetical protein
MGASDLFSQEWALSNEHFPGVKLVSCDMDGTFLTPSLEVLNQGLGLKLKNVFVITSKRPSGIVYNFLKFE